MSSVGSNADQQGRSVVAPYQYEPLRARHANEPEENGDVGDDPENRLNYLD